MQDMQFGCVLFDDHHEHSSGWAAIAGEQAERIRSTEDLRTDVCWITNLNYEFSRNAGLENHARFRRADYLREPLDKLIDRLKIDSPMRAAQEMSNIFGRVMKLTRKILRIEAIPRVSLKQGIREAYGPTDPIVPELVHRALRDAVSYWTNCERPFRPAEETNIEYFKLPYRQHVRKLISTPIPAGDWMQIPNKHLPQTPGEIVAFLQEVENPILARVSANRFRSEVNPLLNYGTNPSSDKSNRQWVTTFELQSLCAFAEEVHIHEALMAESYNTADRLIKIVDSLPSFFDLSLSCCITMENIWAAVGTTKPPPPHERISKYWTNPATPYLRALDRIECLGPALILQEYGFEIAGYGAGGVLVNTFGIDDHTKVKAALAANLIPPLCNVSQRDFDFGDGKEPVNVLRALYATGRIEKILEVDRAICEEKII